MRYANDITLTLKKNTLSLNKAFQTVELICSHAGSKINLKNYKCKLMGKLKSKHDIIEGVEVTNSAVRRFGIYLPDHKNQCHELNWIKNYNDMLFF